MSNQKDRKAQIIKTLFEEDLITAEILLSKYESYLPYMDAKVKTDALASIEEIIPK